MSKKASLPTVKILAAWDADDLHNVDSAIEAIEDALLLGREDPAAKLNVSFVSGHKIKGAEDDYQADSVVVWKKTLACKTKKPTAAALRKATEEFDG